MQEDSEIGLMNYNSSKYVPSCFLMLRFIDKVHTSVRIFHLRDTNSYIYSRTSRGSHKNHLVLRLQLGTIQSKRTKISRSTQTGSSSSLASDTDTIRTVAPPMTMGSSSTAKGCGFNLVNASVRTRLHISQQKRNSKRLSRGDLFGRKGANTTTACVHPIHPSTR